MEIEIKNTRKLQPLDHCILESCGMKAVFSREIGEVGNRNGIWFELCDLHEDDWDKIYREFWDAEKSNYLADKGR